MNEPENKASSSAEAAKPDVQVETTAKTDAQKKEPEGLEPKSSSSAEAAGIDVRSDEAKGTEDAQAVSQKRKRIAFASVAAAVVLCAVLMGVGVAFGWFTPGFFQTVTQDEASSITADEIAAEKGERDTPEASSDDEGKEEETAEGAADEEGARGAEGADRQGQDANSAEVEAEAAGSSRGGSTSGDSPAQGSGSASDQAPASEPAPEPEAQAPKTITVSVYIDSSRASDLGYPSCMASATVTLNEGASVYDALRATGVSIGGSGSYVSSINGLVEFAGGSGSGWLYSVNGSFPNYGSSSYILSGGESVSWIYTLERGDDL